MYQMYKLFADPYEQCGSELVHLLLFFIEVPLWCLEVPSPLVRVYFVGFPMDLFWALF